MLGVCVYSTFTYLREDNTGLPGSLCLSRDTRRPYSVIWKSLSPFQDVGIVEKYWATIHPELADQYSMSTELRFTPTIKGLIITLLQVGGQWWRSPGCEHTTRCVLEAFCLTLNPEFGLGVSSVPPFYRHSNHGCHFRARSEFSERKLVRFPFMRILSQATSMKSYIFGSPSFGNRF